MEKKEIAVIIDGKKYEYRKSKDEYKICENCALQKMCHNYEDGIICGAFGVESDPCNFQLVGDETKVSITYDGLAEDVEIGKEILIDDGLIEMTVEDIKGEEIVCHVVNGGFVSNHKGVNVPGAVLSMPYISDVDRADIEFGAELGFDFLAASFAI